MKKTVLTIAAVLALTGAAFAGTTQPAKQAQAAACVETKAKVKLDCSVTGSLDKQGATTGTRSTEGNGPRLGISVNPWIMPSTF